MCSADGQCRDLRICGEPDPVGTGQKDRGHRTEQPELHVAAGCGTGGLSRDRYRIGAGGEKRPAELPGDGEFVSGMKGGVRRESSTPPVFPGDFSVACALRGGACVLKAGSAPIDMQMLFFVGYGALSGPVPPPGVAPWERAGGRRKRGARICYCPQKPVIDRSKPDSV